MNTPPSPPKLLDRLADALRARGYVAALRQAYVDWVRRYVHFHHLRHPRELGAPEVAAFLEHLALQADLPPATEVEARAALTFLYAIVLAHPLDELPTAIGRLPEGTSGDLCPAAGSDCPRFLEQLRHVLRVRHYSLRTEDCYVDWVRRYVLFHGKRHPCDLGHKSLEITMIYTHVMEQGVRAVKSPLDLLYIADEQVRAAVAATRRLQGEHVLEGAGV